MSTSYTQSELSAKTVKDLKAILSELKLSQDGKKADLVTRILEQQNGAAADGAATTGTEDKAAASSESATPAPSGNITGENTNSKASTGGEEAQLSDKAGQEATKEEEQSLPLPAGSDKNDEAERRINRLKRFGNPDDIAKLERMEKFGSQTDAVDEKSISLLDSELSNKRQRKDKAGTSTPTATNGKPASQAQKANNGKQQEGGRPNLNRAKSNGGKPAAGGKGGASPQKGGAAKAAPPALSPEEEEKRRKRAERFNAAS